MLRLIRGLEHSQEVCWHPLGQLGGRIHAGFLEQVGVLWPDAFNAGEVDAIDPIKDQRLLDARRLRELVATGRLRRALEQRISRLDARERKLGLNAEPIPSTSTICYIGCPEAPVI